LSSETPETPPAEKPPVEVIDASEANAPAPPEATVGTGSYIAVSCTLGMLVLTVILIGVVFLIRWLE
jgi:hypothetical protein